MALQPKRVVTVKLTPEEARSLEVQLDDAIHRLRQRNAERHSTAADGLIERYEAISEKVRAARNPDATETKHKATVTA